MNDAERLRSLIDRWEELRQSGAEPSIDDLCADCPELANQLRDWVETLRASDWLNLPITQGDAGTPPQPTISNLGLPPKIGRYELRQVKGEGGFGFVVEAYDPKLQRTVAIKIARPERAMSPEQAERFVTEARHVARLKHPGIVSTHDVGQDGQWCFIVTDLVDGRDLATLMREICPSVEQTVKLAADVADILEFAHEQGLIHRDIKPANILVEDSGRVFLTDFGIAVTREQLLAGKPQSEGTLPYMPPEQLDLHCETVSPQCDIYSLGVVLYELLTGQLPFPAGSPSAMLKAMHTSPKAPSQLNHNVPATLDSVCLRALSREPKGRFVSAGEFGKAVRKAIVKKKGRRLAFPTLVVAASLLLFGAAVWSFAWNADPDPPGTSSPEPPLDPAAPVPGASKFDGYYYKYIVANVTWHEAKRRCEELDGNLVIIRDAQEQEFIANLVGNDLAYVLIGITDEKQEDDWRWVDGSPAEFTNWAEGEPNQLGGIEHYGAMNPAAESIWLDIAARHRGIRGFVCQWKAEE